MAFRDKTVAISDEPMWENGILNVRYAVGNKEVGTGAPAINELTDTMLVYYFIYYLYRFGNSKTFKPFFDLSDPDFLPPAQNYHSRNFINFLSKCIMQCQKDMIRVGTKVFPDGRCDRAQQSFTNVTHSRYTITFLNVHYAFLIKRLKSTEDWQHFLVQDLLAPQPLRWKVTLMDVINF